MRRPGRPRYQPPSAAADPLLQEQPTVATSVVRRHPAMPTTLRSFEGMGKGFTGPQGGFVVDGDPPDTNGDIGPNHYVQAVNSSLSIFDRSGNVLYGPYHINTLWHGFGGACETTSDGDPIVKYDKRADRWLVMQFSATAPNFMECIAVSTTGDPSGSYYRYAYSFATSPDYAKIGVWPDGYYFTFNGYDAKDNFVGGEICVLDRSAMLAGRTAAKQCYGPNIDWFGMLPADLDGASDPPPGSPGYVMGLGSATSLYLWKLRTDWTTATNSTLAGPTSITIARYTDLCTNASDGSTCVPQLGTSTLLDSLGGYLMYRLAYRNMGSYETILANHSVDQTGSGTGPGAIRWYEVRSPATTPVVYQQGTFAPDSRTRWMGSMAMDGSGNIALGYSLSGSTMYPSAYFSGRLVADPLNALPQGETALANSTGYHYDATGQARWGDYSSLSVDPSDDCTFWYTNEYFTSSVRDSFQWQTRIGTFKFPSCSTPQSSPYSGLWWNPSESGWGMSVSQHGAIIFAAMYTYDQLGQPTWYVMSNCRVTAKSCSDTLYKVSGGTAPTAPWNGAGKVVSAAGSGTLSFADNNSGSFNFSINGVSGAKSIVRQSLATGSAAPLINYTDLWWNPDESGWGVAITQEYATIFAAWYSYDSAGNAIWYVASNCPVVGNACTGDLYQVTGGVPLTTPWNGDNKLVANVGSVTFTFADASNGTMSYTLGGIRSSRSISRQPF